MEKHPITPPPELAAKWVHEIYGNPSVIPLHDLTLQVIEHAAQWGADRQLEADAEWLDRNSLDAPHLTITPTGKGLVEAMRPKPPSFKEQAIAVLDDAELDAAHYNILLRALEALPDD